jgi:DNA-binding MarR family transcriptional regulator
LFANVVRHLSKLPDNPEGNPDMADPQPARAAFGMTLAFAERALTKRLHASLASEATPPSTWYALQLSAPTRPRMRTDAFRDDLAGAPTLDAESASTTFDALVAEGLIRVDDDRVIQTPAGEALHRRLRETVNANGNAIFDELPDADLETTVRVLRELTHRAEALEAA